MSNIKNLSIHIAVSFLIAFCIVHDAKGARDPNWIQRARKVGQSETPAARNAALAGLRKQKNLSSKLVKALDSKDRALALDAIGALPLKDLVPELQKRASSDPDGFLILTLSSLLDQQNKDSILSTYKEALDNESEVSPAAIVAMLEPLGRLGEVLDKSILEKLAAHPYPEVRSAVLSYIRAHALLHNKRDHDNLVTKAIGAPEFQIRMQAISFAKEINSQSGKPAILPHSELEKHCLKERASRVREQCLVLIRKGQP